MRRSKRITIIGGGAWGTAIAARQSFIGNKVTLYVRDGKVRDEINLQHKNSKYFGDHILPDNIYATSDLKEAMLEAEVVLLVIPAQQISKFLVSLEGILPENVPLVICAKGIEETTGRTMSQVVKDIFPKQQIAVLSGPSFACDVVKNVPVAVTLASEDLSYAKDLAAILSGSYFRVYASDDIKGVELGGALKNILAIATGMVMGYNLGLSAQSALITRGFVEVRRIGVHLGGKNETFLGLSGLGDLILTCSSAQSRNYFYGLALAQGEDLNKLKLAEGVATAKIAAKICIENEINAPIIKTVAALLENNITMEQALELLLDRPLKKED